VRHIGRVESLLGLGWYYRIPNKRSVHQRAALGMRFERITSDVMTKTYEMLWDCGYCATRALLGKSHRFCPSCGAPQDPIERYQASAGGAWCEQRPGGAYRVTQQRRQRGACQGAGWGNLSQRER
jgi:hypothetical protein